MAKLALALDFGKLSHEHPCIVSVGNGWIPGSEAVKLFSNLNRMFSWILSSIAIKMWKCLAGLFITSIWLS